MSESRLAYNSGAANLTMVSGTEYFFQSDGTFVATPTPLAALQFNLAPGEDHVFLQFQTYGGDGVDGFAFTLPKVRLQCAAYPSTATVQSPGINGGNPFSFSVPTDATGDGSLFLFGTQMATAPTLVALDGVHSLFSPVSRLVGPDLGSSCIWVAYIGAPAGVSLKGIQTLYIALSIQHTIVVSPAIFKMEARLIAKSA